MMVISGVYKTPEVMENMVANGKCDRIFTVESLTQFNLFRELSENIKENFFAFKTYKRKSVRN